MVGVQTPDAGGDMTKAVYDTGGNNKIDKDKLDGIEQGLVRKKKSDTLKHSHDVLAGQTAITLTETKRITFTTGLKGAIRVKWTSVNCANAAAVSGESELRDQDGTLYGTLVVLGANNVTAVTTTEDMDAADFQPGDYLVINARNDYGSVAAERHCDITNFRIYYDENSEDFVNV